MVNLANMLAASDPTYPGLHASSGGRLVALDGRQLPLKSARISAEATGGIARVVLEQTFVNPHAQRLAVRYLLPLPSEGAVSGFSFRLHDRVITGEIDRRARARERFERALVSGKTAALLEEDRDSLFTQELGNIPPNSELVAELVIDQPLVWLYEGAWEWRFPTVVGARYMGEEGRVRDAKKISVDVANGPLPTRAQLMLSIGDQLLAGRRPESPSHAMRVASAETRTQVVLDSATGVALDRDIVVRWPVAKPEVGVTVDCARPAAAEHNGKTYALLTLVPPDPTAKVAALPRDLIFLIDTSGSMGGTPLEQAKKVISLMIESLEDADRLELIEFGSAPRRWQKAPVVMTREGKKEALKWVRNLQASGSTEMRAAVLEALRPLRPDAQRQIVLITDGFVGFEREITREVLERLPRSSRLHTLGVGSSVNRTLTRPVARAGAGIEVVLGLDEDAERGAVRMIARTARPIVTELNIEGDGLLDVVPRRLPDLFAGAPVKIAVALDGDARTLRVRGKTAEGVWENRAQIAELPLGGGQQAIAARFAREAVEDREAHLAGGGDQSEIEADIERIGLEFQIATRLTSWIAISEDVKVDPKQQLMREVMPHELPYGTSMEGLGLRGAQPSNMMLGGPIVGAFAKASKSIAFEDDVDDLLDGGPSELSDIPVAVRRNREEVPMSVAPAEDEDVEVDAFMESTPVDRSVMERAAKMAPPEPRSPAKVPMSVMPAKRSVSGLAGAAPKSAGAPSHAGSSQPGPSQPEPQPQLMLHKEPSPLAKRKAAWKKYALWVAILAAIAVISAILRGWWLG